MKKVVSLLSTLLIALLTSCNQNNLSSAEGELSAQALVRVTSTEDFVIRNGNCSLKEALQVAINGTRVDACARGGGTREATTITLARGAVYTIKTPWDAADFNGLPTIPSGVSITLEGNGAIIERSEAPDTPPFGFLRVKEGASLILNQITLSNGNGDLIGEALSNQGVLHINQSIITKNRGGYAISSSGDLEIRKSEITNNYHHGIYTRGVGASLTVEDTTIDGNRHGIFYAVGVGGEAGIINRSTISNNDDLGLNAFGEVFISNSTFSGNWKAIGGGAVYISSSTITDNRVGIGHATASGGTIYLDNTIVANNHRFDCWVGYPIDVISRGYNLDSDRTCNLAPHLGDILGVDPQLEPLTDNGGPTWTHALRSSSPALNTGDPTISYTSDVYDQRGYGYARVSNWFIDIGAYEKQDAGGGGSIDIDSCLLKYLCSFIEIPKLIGDCWECKFDLSIVQPEIYRIRLTVPELGLKPDQFARAFAFSLLTAQGKLIARGTGNGQEAMLELSTPLAKGDYLLQVSILDQNIAQLIHANNDKYPFKFRFSLVK